MQTSSGGDDEDELALVEELGRLVPDLPLSPQGVNASSDASLLPQLYAAGPSTSGSPQVYQGMQPAPAPPTISRPSSTRPHPSARQQPQLERASLEHAPGPPAIMQEAVEVLSANADTISRMLYPAAPAELLPAELPEGETLDQEFGQQSHRSSSGSGGYSRQGSGVKTPQGHSILKQPGSLSRRGSELRAVFKDMDPTFDPGKDDGMQDAIQAFQAANNSGGGTRSAKSSENGTGILRSASSKRRPSLRRLVFSDNPGEPEQDAAPGSAPGSTPSTRHPSTSGAPAPDEGLLVKIGSMLSRTGSMNMFRLSKRGSVEAPEDEPPLRPVQSEFGGLPKTNSVQVAAAAVQDKGRSKSIDGGDRKQRKNSVFSMMSDALRMSRSGAAPESQTSVNQASLSKQRRSSVASFFGRAATGASDAPELVRSNSGRRSRNSGMLMGTTSATGKTRQHSMIDLLNNLVTRNKNDDEFQEYYFTSIHDFKPLTVTHKRSNHMHMYYATANSTGLTYMLKRYDKERMEPATVRRVRGALGISEQLSHASLVPVQGNWETDDAIFIVEEYASKGDLLHDHLSHASKYTEAYLATHVIKPLLTVLAFLHAHKVIHRAVYPENMLFGKEGKLLLGSYSTMQDISRTEATDRSGFLDYMAPELVSVKDQEERSKLTPQTSLKRRSLRRNQAAAAAAAAFDPIPAGATPGVQSAAPEAVCEGMPLPFSSASPRAPGFLNSSDIPPNSARSRATDASEGATSPRGEGTRKPKRGVSYTDLRDTDAAPSRPTGIGLLGALASTFRRLNMDAEPSEDGRASRVSRRGISDGMVGQLNIPVAHNPWEWQRYYDEKVDIWQVGCLVHEILCGALPFETEDRLLTTALILWADIQVFPNDLSPQCISFMQACMTKNPRARPSAEELLTHEWITRHEAGETLPSIAQLENVDGASAPSIFNAGNVLGMLKQAINNGKQVLSSFLRRGAGSRDGDEATRPGGITPVPRKVYLAQGLPDARGELRRMPRAPTS